MRNGPLLYPLQVRPLSWCRTSRCYRERILVIMDLGFVKDGDSTLMFTLTPPQTKDAGIEVSKGCYCFVIDVSGR